MPALRSQPRPGKGGRGFPRSPLSLGAVSAVLGGLGTAWILALMILVDLDVLGRGAFRRPIRGVPELAGLSMVGIVFLQLAHALRAGRFTRCEGLIDRLLARWPPVGHGLLAVFHLTGAAVFGVILYVSVPLFLKAWRLDDYVGVAGYFTAPVWPIRLIIFVGSGVVVAEYLALTRAHLARALAGAGRATPSAPP